MRAEVLFRDVEAWSPAGWERTDLALGTRAVLARGAGLADACEARTIVEGRGRKLVPGLVDVHLHGYAGHDVTSGGPVAARLVASALARAGTTRFLATLYPSPPERLRALIAAYDELLREQRGEAPRGARVEGLHLEGPFVSRKRAGALEPECLRDPDLAEVRTWLREHPGVVRRITIAPELTGAHELLRLLLDHGVRPSLGHSDCTCREAEVAAKLGPLAVTHLFNAMRGVHHREPGLALAALEIPELVPELICDGVHVAPEVLRFVHETRGARGVVMISDALWPAGSDVLEFEAGGKRIRQGADAMWAEQGMLAGAKLCLLEMIRSRVADGTFELHAAIGMASFWPARELGLRADLLPGGLADALLLAADGGLDGVWIDGCAVPGSP
ncbi:MAG: N-acetylglucosamine-6-phosphate deacetylase [Planctomycetes bacterium]|nr:N-acetylglucosamine-6-phosphate deacetylase [Planctomycetota bacterium]